MKHRIQYVYSILLLVGLIVYSASAFAINGRTTYQAKIYKPDGQPLEAVSVNFRFTVLDPSSSCVLFVEDYAAVNMIGSGGLTSFSLGMGTRTYPASGPTTFAGVFDNSTPSFVCQSPGVYNPIPTDNRKVVMQFNEGSGWQTLPAMAINSVPYAMYSAKAQNSSLLNGKADSAFVEVSTLAGLSCQANEAIQFNGANFSCIAVGVSSSGISSVTTSGTVLSTGGTASAPVISITAATMSSDGYLTSLDYAEFKAKLSASSTEIINTLGYAPVSSSAVNTQIQVSNLAGDVSGTIAANFVQSVGGKTSAQVATSVDDTLAATSSATADTIVKRNASGNFTANDVYASSTKLNYVDIYKPSTSFNIRLQAPTSLAANYTLNLPTSSGTVGQVLSTDGSGNLSWISAATGSVTSVSATAPLVSTGGATPSISITQSTSSTDGYLSSADWNTFNNKQQATSAAIITTLGYTPADNAASGTYLVKANNLSDLVSATVARTNLGLGSLAVLNSIDLSGSQASGTLAAARLPAFSGDASSSAGSAVLTLTSVGAGVTSGTQYTKVTVDSKGRVTSGAQLASGDVTTALGYTPASASAATQWLTSGSTISHSAGNVGVGTTAPTLALHVAGTNGFPATSGTSQTGTFRVGNTASQRVLDMGIDGATSTAWLQSTTMTNLGNGNNLALNPNGGNVGIGTTVPVRKFHVAGLADIVRVGPHYPTLDASIDRDYVELVAHGTDTRLSSTNERFHLENLGGSLILQGASGDVGIGLTAPTAKLHLSSGTASFAPLKFTSGTLLTSAQSGTMEYDGFYYYITDGAGTRRSIATVPVPGTYDNATNINATGNITMTPVGSVVVSSTTASTNSQTGALIVNGGAGIAGNLNVGGSISGSATIKATGFRANQGAPDAADSSTVGYAFGSDGDTGLFSPGSGAANGVLAFYSNNAEKMRMTSTGLGIGTPTPSSKLEINDTSVGNTTLPLALTNTSNTNDSTAVGMAFNVGSVPKGAIIFNRNSLTYGLGDIQFATNQVADNIAVVSTADTKMTIKNNGNVGIGTASPKYKLDVNGLIKAEYVANLYVDYNAVDDTGDGLTAATAKKTLGSALAISEALVASHVVINVLNTTDANRVNIGPSGSVPAYKRVRVTSSFLNWDRKINLYDGSFLDLDQVDVLMNTSMFHVRGNNNIVRVFNQGGTKRIMFNQNNLSMFTSDGLWGSYSAKLITAYNYQTTVITAAAGVTGSKINEAGGYQHPLRIYLHWNDANFIDLANVSTDNCYSDNILTTTFAQNGNGFGNVGIASATPGSRLTIKGSGNTSTTSSLHVTNSSNQSMLFVQDEGSVGIGTTSPQKALHVLSSSNQVARFESSSTDSILLMRDNATGASIAVGIGSVGNELKLVANNTERLRINSSGNVGIGTSAPTTKLEVAGGDINVPTGRVSFNAGTTAGTAGIASSDTGSIFGEHDLVSEVSRLVIEIYDNVNDQIVMRTNAPSGGTNVDMVKVQHNIVSLAPTTGNVGVGVETPTSKLQVNGGIKQPNLGQIISTLDGAARTTSMPAFLNDAYMNTHQDEVFTWRAIAPNFKDSTGCGAGPHGNHMFYNAGDNTWGGTYRLVIGKAGATNIVDIQYSGWGAQLLDAGYSTITGISNGSVNATLTYSGGVWTVEHMAGQIETTPFSCH